ncbi:MAG: GDP-mannose 4,6-dehydratase [Betaproteobacteria bacterium]|nr:GDP-mannose 4,6-dehydratase [Betaproteobacteria bacterium]
MKTILVTGGAGFIGSNFVNYLYTRYPDYRIVVLDALTYAGSVHNLPEGGFDSQRFAFWYGNVLNADLVDALVAEADIVVHFAAESHVTRSIFDNRQFFETDVLGTQVIANAVLRYRKQVDRFIHISTSEVYGSALAPLMTEEHPLNPMSPYAAAKCGADRLVYSYYQTYRIPAVIVRPFNNYGPRQHLEKAIPRFITSCILGEPITVHGDGSARRDFIHVDDHCTALDRLIHAEQGRVVGEVFNLGSGRDISVLEIAQAVRVAMACPDGEIRFVGERPGQVFRHTCDSRKAREVLDWAPSIDFEDGLARTVAWYQANQAWWQPQRWMRQIPIITAEGKKELH